MKKSLAIGLIFFGYFNFSQAQTIAAPWLDQYNRATNYRSVVDAAIKSPLNGGYFYAHKILSECKAAGDNYANWSERISKNENQITASIKNSLTTIKNRCENFTEEELSDAYLAKLAKEGIAGSDPLWMASMSYTHSASKNRGGHEFQARRADAVSAAFQVKDPLVVQDLGMRLVIDKNPNGGKTTFKINGKNTPLNSKVDLGLAIYLVPCELGLNCDATDFAVSVPCASQGLCDASRYEAVRRMASESKGDYEGILKAARSIADSLAEPDKNGRVLD
ncbi:MAG: hypothetical protein PHI55_03750 [Burkholderiaceae bacterium]|nr:hypothetical protein [Burkholderiaceae bacterium]